MSAFVQSSDHIDLLVTALDNLPGMDTATTWNYTRTAGGTS